MVKSADRSIDLLELLARHPQGVTLGEAVAELGMPKSSVHALLQTLARRGYAEWNVSDRRYQLGAKLWELTSTYSRGHDLIARAGAAVRELAAQSGETAHLAVLHGTDAVSVAAEDGAHSMRLVSQLGRRIPGHATAAGKVLLAGLTPEDIRRRYASAGIDVEHLPRRTWRTASSLSDVLRELEEVRCMGHAHEVEEYAAGVHAVAAPIFDAAGSVGAALSLAIPSARLTADRLVRLVAMTKDAAARVSTAEGKWPASPWREGQVRIAWSMGSMLVPALREMHRAVMAASPSRSACVLWADACEDERKQACDVHQLLAFKPDVLVLHPAHALHADVLFDLAAATGVPTICFQRPVRSERFALFVGGDTFQEGVLQIEYVAQRLGGHGNVVLIEGDPYNDNARNVAEGNRFALRQHPGLRLVAHEVSPLWSRETAARIAAELLDRHGVGAFGIDAIVCANDDMASGVAEVLTDRGLAGRVVLVGGDGDEDAARCIRQGVQHATVFQDPAAVAERALDAAVALAHGALDPGTLPRRALLQIPASHPVPVADVPYRLVTVDNVGELEAYWAGARVACNPRGQAPDNRQLELLSNNEQR